MTHPNDHDDLEGLLGAYDGPGPRPDFVRHLRARLEGELAAALAARRKIIRLWTCLGAAAAALAVGIGWALLIDGAGHTPDGPDSTRPAAFGTPRQVPFTLPEPAYACTPRAVPTGPHIEPYPGPERPAVFVPAGTRNLAFGKPVTSSDPRPIIGELHYVTDGDKETTDGSYVEIAPNLQWVQIDLQQSAVIHAIALWRYAPGLRVYHDVIVQISDDPHFQQDVHTIFNNDYDNSAGLGVGEDMEYVEDYRGRVIETGGVRGRYVRLYSAGNIDNDQNHYVEVEVYGRPGEPMVPLEVDLPHFWGGVQPIIDPRPHLEPYEDKPRPPFLVPRGTVNLSRGRPVASSETHPILGELDLVTDGDKQSHDGHVVELGRGLHWVQIDLERRCRLHAILVWHYWQRRRVYHDVIVQVSDDPAFETGVRTLFNNDFDGSANLGLGKGKDLEYVEDFRGRLIDPGGVPARYVRLYSAGNSTSDLNHYVEVEVYGRPAADLDGGTPPSVRLDVERPRPACW